MSSWRLRSRPVWRGLAVGFVGLVLAGCSGDRSDVYAEVDPVAETEDAATQQVDEALASEVNLSGEPVVEGGVSPEMQASSVAFIEQFQEAVDRHYVDTEVDIERLASEAVVAEFDAEYLENRDSTIHEVERVTRLDVHRLEAVEDGVVLYGCAAQVGQREVKMTVMEFLDFTARLVPDEGSELGWRIVERSLLGSVGEMGCVPTRYAQPAKELLVEFLDAFDASYLTPETPDPRLSDLMVYDEFVELRDDLADEVELGRYVDMPIEHHVTVLGSRTDYPDVFLNVCSEFC